MKVSSKMKPGLILNLPGVFIALRRMTELRQEVCLQLFGPFGLQFRFVAWPRMVTVDWGRQPGPHRPSWHSRRLWL